MRIAWPRRHLGIAILAAGLLGGCAHWPRGNGPNAAAFKDRIAVSPAASNSPQQPSGSPLAANMARAPALEGEKKTAAKSVGEPEVNPSADSAPPEIVLCQNPDPLIRRTQHNTQNPAHRGRAQGPSPNAGGAAGWLNREGNYLWIIGPLEYLYVRNVWRIRYESNGCADPFGGSLILPASYVPNELHAGQWVQVQGQVLENENHRQFLVVAIFEEAPVDP